MLGRGVAIPPDEVSLEYSRSSGPGGQHVNKTETRVTLRFDLGGSRSIPEADKARMIEKLSRRVTKSGHVLVSCDAERDRSRNTEVAWARLSALLARAFERPKPRTKTKPSRASKERRLEQKRRTSSRKRSRQVRHDD